MSESYDFGRKAEEKAVEFLNDKNYKILARNWRYLKAEIDIIALDETNDEICIVEVKARRMNALVDPELAVSKSKRKLLVLATHQFLQVNNLKYPVRFDIISIKKSPSQWIIKHIENAFYSFE